MAWTNWPLFTVGLVQRGYSDEHIRQIIGGNVLRVAAGVVAAESSDSRPGGLKLSAARSSRLLLKRLNGRKPLSVGFSFPVAFDSLSKGGRFFGRTAGSVQP